MHTIFIKIFEKTQDKIFQKTFFQFKRLIEAYSFVYLKNTSFWYLSTYTFIKLKYSMN